MITLRTVRYNDRHSIVSAYTLERGRMSFLQPAGAGREASRRRALMMPLGLVEGVADMRPGRDVHPLGQTRALEPLAQLRSNPVKMSLAMFLAEVLGAILHDAQPDPLIWRYVAESVRVLDALPGSRLANFHICFLMRLGPLVGIEPDTSSYAPGRLFDMADGIFRLTAPTHRDYLPPDESAAIYQMTRISYANMHLFAMTRDERARMLDGVLHYYSIHYAPLGNLHSLDILRGL